MLSVYRVLGRATPSKVCMKCRSPPRPRGGGGGGGRTKCAQALGRACGCGRGAEGGRERGGGGRRGGGGIESLARRSDMGGTATLCLYTHAGRGHYKGRYDSGNNHTPPPPYSPTCSPAGSPRLARDGSHLAVSMAEGGQLLGSAEEMGPRATA